MGHIRRTLETIETKIAQLTMHIEGTNKLIQHGLKTDSSFFGSDEHLALFKNRSDYQRQRDELHEAYMIIVKHF